MPRLSDTMEEGTVAKWLKKVGDPVKQGDMLAEIETDKATMEFESFYDGYLLHIAIQEGETAPVDTLMAVIGEKDEDISELLKPDQKPAAQEEKKEEDKPQEESSDDFEIPDDVAVITMPRLSDTMEEGTVASWLKKEGDTISEGDMIAEIETDKATMEFESFYSGILLKTVIAEGESAPVDSLMAIIGPEGTDVEAVLNHFKNKKTDAPPSEEAVKKEEPAAPAEAAPRKEGERIFASPLARRMAKDKGIDLALVQGTGESGRIVKRDIENYKPAPAKAAAAYQPAGTEGFEEVQNSQMRKTIARRLSESKFTAPEYYLTVELDMDRAIEARKSINENKDVRVSFNDMIIKACAMALRKHPQVNSQWTPEATRIARHIHIGVAVAVDEGLLVPVVRFADQLSFTQIGDSVRELAGKARERKIKPEEMEGSTFTVSNLGMFGIHEFTSIINQPNSGILSVGAIVQKPVVKNGGIVVGNTMTVTLACDHRTVDGATGALFLQTLKQYIENPVTMLV